MPKQINWFLFLSGLQFGFKPVRRLLLHWKNFNFIEIGEETASKYLCPSKFMIAMK